MEHHETAAGPAADGTLTHLLFETAEQDPSARLFSIPDSFGGWFDLTGAEFVLRVRALAKGFLAAELQSGDTLAVLCSNRFEATLVDFAAATIGVSVAPLDPESEQADLLATLESSRARAVIVETVRDFARVDEIHGDLPLVSDVWQIGLADLDKLADLGRTVADEILDARIATVTPDSAAALIDDGGELAAVSHSTMLTRAADLAYVLDGLGAVDADDSGILQILPPTDPFARLTTLLALATSTRLGHLAVGHDLIASLASFRPTLLVAHPATFDAIEQATNERADQGGRGPALKQALDVAVEFAEATADGSASRGLKTRYAVADTLVLRGLRKTVGGRVRAAVAIGGPIGSEPLLRPDLRRVMRGLDVVPIEVALVGESLVVVEAHDDDDIDPDGTEVDGSPAETTRPPADD